MYSVAALYKFSPVVDPEATQELLKKQLLNHKIFGTILVGYEGLNGTISGDQANISIALNCIKDLEGFDDIDIKFSESKDNPFLRLKVKLKDEIVTIGNPSINPNIQAGNYVDASDWNNLIKNEDVLLIDVRNDYECSIGTFNNSVNPKTKTFKDFPKWVDSQGFSELDKNSKKVAMFCTGGIRCEKASSYMKNEGFNDVYHLKGGILKYFESVDEDNSLWNGECFVFDDRVSVKQDLSVGSYDMCHGCRLPITDLDKDSNKYQKGISCPSCFDTKTDEQKSRYASRQFQVSLAKERNEKHIGVKYNKK
tara:strand:+ start:120 stop:1046 length:927 start_codon:yes stop_codon:yes gene_type:complete